MKNYTLTISENSNKAKALIEYLKTLDFVEFKKSEAIDDSLSAAEQKLIEMGFDDLRNNRLTPHEEVERAIREKISKAQ